MNSLKKLSDQELEIKIKSLVQEERTVQLQVIEHLEEVDSRKLHLNRGFGSLYDYCVRELGYSEGSAFRRIEAMRALRENRGLATKLESGKLNLTNIALVQSLCKKVEIAPEVKRELFGKIESKSKRECEQILVAIAPESAAPREQTRVISPEKSEIRFVADQALLEKLERLKSLLSHSCPDQTYAQLFEVMADQLLKTLEKPVSPEKLNQVSASKTVSAPTQRFIHQKGRCQYVDPNTGRQCQSRYQLQTDHIHPKALGGTNDPSNLELVCRQHNLLRARLKLGKSLMQRHWPR